MEATKEIQFKIWYRPQFLNNVCNVCKQPAATTCPNCGLVSYCGQEHLSNDVDDHEDICEALMAAAKVLGTQKPHDKAHLLGADQWREFRLGLANMCSRHLGRPLLPYELEICLFPPLCATCHVFSGNLLKCPACFCVSWCTPQHKPKDHSSHCNHLILYRNILQRRIPAVKITPMSDEPLDIDSLGPKNDRDIVCYSLLTEVATSPLSVLQHLPQTNEAVVHLIGPEPQFEANNLAKWDVFLFTLRQNLTSLTIHFIGPEIGPLPSRTTKKDGKTLTTSFHQLLYHEFVEENGHQKPTVICALNPGLYRSQGFNGQDSWAETINAMFRHKDVPVLVTAYTKKEVGLDHDRILKQVPTATTVVKPGRNPFSSQRPLMNFVSDEITPIVFKNAYYTVLMA